MPNENDNTQDISHELELLITCCQVQPDLDEIKLQMSNEQLEMSNGEKLISLSARHGVLPLVYKTLNSLPAAHYPLPTEILSAFKQQYRSIAQKNMLMSAELLRVMKLLESNGIEALAFKGPVLAQMAYEDITLRQYGDLDILVTAEQMEAAVTLLEREGYEAYYPLTPLQRKHHLAASHEYTLKHKEKGVVVELHWRLSSEEFMVDLDGLDLFHTKQYVSIQKKEIPTFGTEALIIYLAVHGTKHYWERIEWLIDITLLVAQKPIAWQTLISLCEKTQTEKILYSTFYLCRHLLGLKLPAEAESYFVASEQYREISEKLFEDVRKGFEDPSYTKTLSSIQFQMLEKKRSKLSYVTALFRPTQLDYLSVKLPDRLHFLYYFVRPINILMRKLKR